MIDRYLQVNSIKEDNEYNQKMIDLMKYIAAIMVICIHCNHLFSHEFLDFFVRQIICRIAVPFFFISSAYFVRKRSVKDDMYVKTYLKKFIKSYFLWSLVFIPIGLDWIHQNLNLAGYLLPFALIYGFIHIGTYYHLWYIPAVILTTFLIDKLLKRYSYKILFIISAILFIFGSIESYYGILSNGWFKDFFDLLISIIFTTRSGLLYGMIFTLIGYYIYDYRDLLKSLQKYIIILTLFFASLLILEGVFLYNIVSLDMNFLLMLVPFSFFFFLSILFFPYTPKHDTKKVRELSKYYYFIHPVCIVIIEEIGFAFHLNILSSGLISLLLIVLLTHLLSSMVIKIKSSLKVSFVILASLFGMLITFIIAGLLFFAKSTDVIIKFEFVPCLWFYFSFLMYYLLYKRFSILNSLKNKN